jgi:predicted amidohydrolase YtcJ
VLPALKAAVTRRTRLGERLQPAEALTIEQALRAYTMGAAIALGAERSAGSITPGKQADLTVLDRDPTRTDPEALDRIHVLRTYVAGRLAHRLDPVTEAA